MQISLIGPRASGKSIISQYLLYHLGWPLFSLDTLIAYEAGSSIPEIVNDDKRGWSYFRELEYEVLKKAVKLDPAIMDCGGGIVVDLDAKGEEVFSERKAALLHRTTVVLLSPPKEWVLNAIAGDVNRPVLSRGKSPEQIYQERMEKYQRVCHIEYLIKDRNYEQMALDIIRVAGLA